MPGQKIPKKLHLDKNAERLIKDAAAAGAPDDLLNTKATAALIGYSPGTVELMRSRGTGPVFEKRAGRILYPIEELVKWLKACSHRHACTAEYRTHRQPNGKRRSKGNGAAAPAPAPAPEADAAPSTEPIPSIRLVRRAP